MANRRKRRRRVRSGGILLGILLALVLGALTAGGIRLWAVSRPGPTALREGSAGTESRLSLFHAPETQTGEAPEPAPEPEPEQGEESLPYNMVEIIGEEEGLLVARVQGKRYKGFVAFVEDPFRLYVATCPYFGDNVKGRTVKEMADQNGAVLGINGGAFSDPNGEGWGGRPEGNVVANGQVVWGGWGATVGMDGEGKLHVGNFTAATCRELGLQWAVTYGPTLIQDGQICEGLNNLMQEPRTAVGQREDGTVVLLNIQGRQVSALGVTCQELAEIMWELGCVNAGNLDGGASSDMYYRGEYINICNTSGGPRPLPTTVLVAPVAGEEADP